MLKPYKTHWSIDQKSLHNFSLITYFSVKINDWRYLMSEIRNFNLFLSLIAQDAGGHEHPNPCPDCGGRGVTRAYSFEIVSGEHVLKLKHPNCPACKGTGVRLIDLLESPRSLTIAA